MAALDDLKAFDADNAEVSLWVFKKATRKGHPPAFTGRWVETETDLDDAFKEVVKTGREHLDEVLEYGLLAQNNEGSALTIATLETHAGLIVNAVAAEDPKKKIKRLKEIQNTAFYVLKLRHNGEQLLAIKKAGKAFSAKRALNSISLLFEDQTLALNTAIGFEIPNSVDFFVVGDQLIINHKANFESTLSFKEAHKEEFTELRAEPEFADIFTNMQPLVDHVGDNKIHLRRIAAIRQKGHYKDPNFMALLRANYAQYHLNLNFSPQGQLVPCANTCKDIMIALLDHRLTSGFSSMIYDVPNATEV